MLVSLHFKTDSLKDSSIVGKKGNFINIFEILQNRIKNIKYYMFKNQKTCFSFDY